MFYQVTEIVINNKKPQRLYFTSDEVLDETALTLMALGQSNRFLSGRCAIDLVTNKADEDFQDYLKEDLIKVQMEIDKLEKLKDEIIQNLEN